jgi:cellulose synthase/poly-beta-1,6-N-acetylglucosamine synthase-like glycosyltransferase
VIDVSVVIPCYNAADFLGEQLRALADQPAAPPYEVVVVDDGSSDASVAVAERFRDEVPRLHIVRAPHRGNVAAVRNLGARTAGGSRLLFCDADDVIGSGWVAHMAAALEQHDLVAGPFELERLNPPWAVTAGNLTQTDGLSQDGFLPFAGGGNLAIRRAAFEAVDGFDVTMPALEDTDLCFRAQLAGYRLAFVPDALVHVRLRTSIRALYRQGFAWGLGTAALHRRYLEHGMPLPNRLRHLVGWVLALPRFVIAARSPSGRGRWWFAMGWRVGRLRGNVRYRLLLL